MKIEKTLDKITKKIEQIEKMHDKESMLCEEVKDLIEKKAPAKKTVKKEEASAE